MDVVIGIVKSELGVIFMKRADGTPTFPSGKVEAGENHQEALLREIEEETDVKAKITEKLGSSNKEDVKLHFFACTTSSAEANKLKLTEPEKFSSVEWLSPKEIIQAAKERLSPCVKEYLLEQ